MSNDKIESLKLKLKAATKTKIKKESEVLKLRKLERSLQEDLLLTTAEIETLTEQMQTLKYQISQTSHQISMIEICKSSESTKIKAHIDNLNKHKIGFDEMFSKEISLTESRNRELFEKQEEKLRLEKEKNEEIFKKNEELTKQANTIELEAIAIEKECAVLKKRNNAIMLKLRRKLIETQNTRRELMKRNAT